MIVQYLYMYVCIMRIYRIYMSVALCGCACLQLMSTFCCFGLITFMVSGFDLGMYVLPKGCTT